MPGENLTGFHNLVVDGVRSFNPVLVKVAGSHWMGENYSTLVSTIDSSFWTISESENCWFG